MRKRVTLHLTNGVAILSEMTPLLLYQMLVLRIAQHDDQQQWSDIDGSQWDNWFIDFGLIEIIGNPNETEVKQIKATFDSINAGFFSEYDRRKEDDLSKPKAKTRILLTRMLKDIESMCAQLVMRNHQGCWDYGWAFFLSTQQLHQDNK